MTTFAENPPQIKFLGGNTNPLGTIYEVWQRSRDYDLLPEGTPERRASEVALFKSLIFDFTQIPEFVRWSWWVDGMPRAFFDQMTRYRKTAFFARSQRIRDQQSFSDRGEYLTTPRIAENAKWKDIYDTAMAVLDSAYSALVQDGCPAEDARGLLPLHLRTGFAWSMTLRDLAMDIFRARTCHLMQQDYWAHLAERMRADLTAIDPELDTIFRPPCARTGECLTPVEAKARNEAVLTGTRYDLYPCRIWVQKFTPPAHARAIQEVVKEGLTRWAPTMEETIREREQTVPSDQGAD